MARQDDQRKLAEWHQQLRRFEKAGLTVARFCARERVPAQTFWYWRRKRGGSASARQVVPAVFSPVDVVGGGTVTLRFPTGAVTPLQPPLDHRQNIAWFENYRRLVVRCKRKSQMFLAALKVACLIIALRRFRKPLLSRWLQARWNTDGRAVESGSHNDSDRWPDKVLENYRCLSLHVGSIRDLHG